VRTRVYIGLFTLAAAYWATHEHNLAALYVACGVGGILYLLHAIEVKINRLLDALRIIVSDQEIGRD